MELRHLRYFVAVAEMENVSRAAARLHVSQPALSRQVRDLEEELGFRLFDRGARSLRLTAAGRIFLEESRAILGRVADGVERAKAAALAGGELHIGYAMSPTVRILPPALRAFQSEAPGVRVRLHDLSTTEMLEGLRAGRLGIAFMVCPRPARLRGLGHEEVARGAMLLAVPPGHPLARSRTVTLAEAARHPLVAFSREDYPDYHESLATLFAHIPRKPRITREHDSVGSLIASVEAGEGVAIVAESMACVAGPRLKLKPITPTPHPFIIVAAWPKGDRSREAALFLDCVKRVSPAG